jgi:CBS domain-containing protein
MKCEEVMTKDPKCCVPDDTAARVAKLMKTEDVGAIPVCEDRHGKKLIGIVTDRDLVVHVLSEGRDPNKVTVQDVMTRQPSTCRASDDLDKALDAMQVYQVRRIPVVADGSLLIGIIAQADIATRMRQPQKAGQVVEGISRRTGHAA